MIDDVFLSAEKLFSGTERRAPSHPSGARSQATADKKIGADQTTYLFVRNTAPKTGALMSEIYDQFKSEDGFVYIQYSAENTLGAVRAGGDGDDSEGRRPQPQ